MKRKRPVHHIPANADSVSCRIVNGRNGRRFTWAIVDYLNVTLESGWELSDAIRTEKAGAASRKWKATLGKQARQRYEEHKARRKGVTPYGASFKSLGHNAVDRDYIVSEHEAVAYGLS